VLMSTYYGVLGLAMAGGGLLVDGAGARVAWAVAGVVYLVSCLIAFALMGRAKQVRVLEPADPTGLERIRTLMSEIDDTRRRERDTRRSDVALAPPEGERQTAP
jgi:hypothetical protein